MINYRKIFSEGLNADDDFSVIGKGQWINGYNVRTFTTDKGATGRVEAVGGTLLLSNVLPSGTNYNIGACADEARKRILFFNYNSNGNHAVYCYDKPAGLFYTVVTDAQVTGGLNFSKYLRIDRNAKVIGDLLIFSDFNNEPRKINIETGIATNHSGYVSDYTYTTPLAYTSITVIKRPPIYPLSVIKGFGSQYDGNFIPDNTYKFTYQYRYKDNETSALAAYSQLMPYNSSTETFNSIFVSLPFTENIDDDVYAVDICVRRGVSGITSIVKTFDRDGDATAIADHNSNTTALGFTFYDNIQGTPLDAVSSVTSFDPVPLLSKSVEIAKDRLFQGHIKTGYTTPKPTSLALALGSYDTAGAGTYTANWKYFYLTYQSNSGPSTGTVTYYYAYNSTLANTSYYYIAQTSPTPPPSLNSVDATTAWPTENELAAYIQRNYSPPAGNHWVNGAYTFYDTGATLSLVFAVDLNGLQFFKSSSTYKASIVFYDRFRRKCGVVSKDMEITTPGRSATQSVFAANISWTLSNTNAINEIPDWAYYYQIHISKNRTTRFFFQYYLNGTDYVLKTATGTYSYSHSSFVLNSTYACAFDLTAASSAGIGYSFTDGDLIRVYKPDGTNVTLKVLGTDGSFLLATATDLGTLNSSTGFLVEVFTPYKPLVNEGLFETGNVYDILFPGTTSPGRQYSTLSGSINGDCYAIERDKGGSSLYFCEAMSPNDKFWMDWQTDTGWETIVDTIGQKLLKDSFVFSDTFINGTKVNGLNKYQPLNQIDLGAENGSIQKLQLANKTQTDGSVLLAICEDECVSMYLGEVELFDAKGTPYLSKADGVIGTTKALKGSLGTSNPESVFEYNGLVFWWDIRNNCAVQYADNGLFPISKNKFVRPASLFSKKFSTLTTAQIEALGSHPFIIGGFDPYHKEVLFTIPATEATPPKGYLSDYVSPSLPVIYPYDIYDGVGKTLVYKHEADVWFTPMSFQAEMFVKMDNDLYSFQGGQLYLHNQDNLCNFYGTQYKANLMYANNPGAIHTYLSIGLESNKIPSYAHFMTEDPYTQSSDLPYVGISEFVSKQGVIEASLMRDRLSPNVSGTYDAKQLIGDRLIGKALLVMLEYEFVIDTTPLQLRASNIGNIINSGTLINAG